MAKLREYCKRGHLLSVTRRRSSGYYSACSVCVKERQRYNTAKAKADLINQFGGKCVRCGFSDKRALQFDHINGDGHKDRHGMRTYYRVKQSPEKYQLLCANCNWIKRAEFNETTLGQVR